MRTIKFKAKRKGKGQWVSGDLAHSLDGNLNILGFVEEEGKIGFTGAHQIDPDTVCQFTGFLDRTARRFTRATCCGRTYIRSVVSETMRMTIITAR